MPLGLRLTLIVLTCLGAGAGVGWLAGRLLGRAAAPGLGLGGLGLMVWLILSGRAAPGMEGLGLVLLAVLFVLPATGAAVVAAWLAGRRAAPRHAPPG
ncbi:MAG: hypothetical protein ACXIUV_03215 [Alkalilacustris sp.]